MGSQATLNLRSDAGDSIALVRQLLLAVALQPPRAHTLSSSLFQL
jgi:hypothetical protein